MNEDNNNFEDFVKRFYIRFDKLYIEGAGKYYRFN